MAETLEALQANMQQEAALHEPSTSATSDATAETSETLRDHEAKHYPERKGEPPSQRAKSQWATPQDVAAIQEYTKRLREAEKEIGIEPKPNESPRVFELRRRAEMAERVRDARKAAETKPAAVVAPVVPLPPLPVAPVSFEEPEPQINQFTDKPDIPDPYAAWVRAVTAWDRKKEAFEAKQAEQAAQIEEGTKRADFTWQQIADTHGQRLDAFKAATPTFDDDLKPMADRIVPLVMQAAIMLDADGPKYIHHLATHPELFDELFLLSDKHPVTDQTVAAMQRTLKARTQAVPTGAAAPRVVHPAPRLPTPVKTVPQAPPTDGRPTEGSSLREFEQYHYPDGPRGRFRP